MTERHYNYFFIKTLTLQKWKPVQKSKWLKLVKILTCFTPKNLTFKNDLSRIYNERQVSNLVPNRDSFIFKEI